MEVRGTVVAIFVCFVFLGVRANIPLLQGNRLLTGAAVELPGASLIDCMEGQLIVSDFQRAKIMSPSEALTASNFGSYPFTSHAVIPGSLTHGGTGRFAFTKVTHGVISKRTAFALQISPNGEYGYWLPQGGYVDVPSRPGPGDPHYVFTPDYSGCAWTLTPMNNGWLRLRHVEGGHEVDQFNSLSDASKGGTTSYGMQFRDYGYVHQRGRLIKHVTAYAYMHYSNNRWTLHVQHQTCAPRPGNFSPRTGMLQTLKMNYYNQNRYRAITGTEFFRSFRGLGVFS